MRRCVLFQKVGICLAVISLIAVVALIPKSVLADPGKTFKWKMVTTWAPNFPVLQEGCDRLAKNIDIMTNGRLKIKVYAGGELVPPLETFQAVSKGMVQMGSAASYYWAGKVPEAQFFTTLPYGLTPQERIAWLYAGGGLELWAELYEPFNLVPIPMINTGVQMGGWFRKEIKSLADVKGLKFRIPGFGGKVMAKAGANVILLPGSEVFVALERGVIDATEWVGPYHDKRLGLYQAAKYYYYPGWHEPSSVVELMVNKKAWNSLPADLKAIVKAAALENYVWSLAEFDAKNGEALNEMIQKHGVKLRKFPDDVLAQLKKLSKEVLEEEAKKTPMMKKIYASFLKFQEKMVPWTKVSEEAYLDARAK